MELKEIKFKTGARMIVKEGSDFVFLVHDPDTGHTECGACGNEKELCPMILVFLEKYLKDIHPDNRPLLIQGIAEIISKNSDGFCEMVIVKKDEHHD